MRRNHVDRHLGPPAEANRDKHINFVALENNEMDPADDIAHERASQRKKEKHHPRGIKGKNKNRGR